MPDPQMPSPAEPFDRDKSFIETDDGVIAAEVIGDGAPVVMLHPLALAARAWGSIADRLAQRFQVVTVDLRGHGESTWSGEPFSMTDLADDVTAVLDALELERAHLVGMSMGGSIAITFAGLQPHRVDHLLLADTTSWYGEDAVATWNERAEKALNVPREKQVPFQTERWFTEDFRETDPDEVRRVVDIFLATDSRAHAAASRAMGQMDSRELLNAVIAPTLVLAGEEDYATPPEMAQFIAEHVKDGRAVTLPGLRHLSLIQRPDLADVVAAHFEDQA